LTRIKYTGVGRVIIIAAPAVFPEPPGLCPGAARARDPSQNFVVLTSV